MKPSPLSPKRPNLESVTSINADGSRYAIHPADVSGRFTFWRRLTALLLMVIYVGLPWITINGAPAVFIDLEHRRFHGFGLTLVTQDLWVLFFAISGLGFLLFLVTALFGRLWCGWTCPYTVFLEHVFRRIERWFDGDAAKRRARDAAPWTGEKIFMAVLKHGCYLFVSALLAHVFLSYFISLKGLYDVMRQNPMGHLGSFGTVMFFTGAFYFCFAFFREQFCIIMCPYGRLQSALTDEDTVVIGYDVKRGEPRGKATKTGIGDCVDCLRCVKVCPTGIDIRNGLQLECIGCAACIDACDDIMRKLKRPIGLVRYDSMSALKGGVRKWWRPRIFVYFGLAGLGALALLLTVVFRAKPYVAEISRMRGPSFYLDEKMIRNHYQLRLVNKRNQPVSFGLELVDPPAGMITSGGAARITIPALGEMNHPLIILQEKASYSGPLDVKLGIETTPGPHRSEQTMKFLGPHPGHLE